MSLIKTSKVITDFYLPVIIYSRKGSFKTNRYYNNENELFKAYRQLKAIKSKNIKPLYPVVIDKEYSLYV